MHAHATTRQSHPARESGRKFGVGPVVLRRSGDLHLQAVSVHTLHPRDSSRRRDPKPHQQPIRRRADRHHSKSRSFCSKSSSDSGLSRLPNRNRRTAEPLASSSDRFVGRRFVAGRFVGRRFVGRWFVGGRFVGGSAVRRRGGSSAGDRRRRRRLQSGGAPSSEQPQSQRVRQEIAARVRSRRPPPPTGSWSGASDGLRSRPVPPQPTRHSIAPQAAPR